MISDVISWVLTSLGDVCNWFIGLLPNDPFSSVLSMVAPSGVVATGLSWLGYFVNVPVIVGLVTTWAAAVLAYSVYKVFMGWFSGVVLGGK